MELGLETIHFKKDSFCTPKGVLLHSKTSPFAHQKESFCKPKGVLLKNHCFALAKPLFFPVLSDISSEKIRSSIFRRLGNANSRRLWRPRHSLSSQTIHSCHSFIAPLLAQEGVSKVTAVRPEGAEAHSPGHTPWVKVSQIPMRPARAKALVINAFALAGRFAIFNPYTQGAALGYVLLGLSARFV